MAGFIILPVALLITIVWLAISIPKRIERRRLRAAGRTLCPWCHRDVTGLDPRTTFCPHCRKRLEPWDAAGGSRQNAA
jgi:predicted amidophosphoribosyltransferase